jgi:hypothetical protein
MPTSFAKPANNVSVKVGPGGFTAGATTLPLAVGDGAKVPALSAGEWYRLSVFRAAVAYSPLATSADFAVLKATARSGDSFTVDPTTLDGSTARSFVEGDVIELRVTSGTVGDLQAAVNANETTLASAVLTTTSYANPSWITSLAGSKISGNITGNAASITGSITESQVTNLVSDLALKAPLASPTFTGTVTAPTIYGSSASAGNLTIESTSDATKGTITVGASGGTVVVGGGVLRVANTGPFSRANIYLGPATASFPKLLQIGSTLNVYLGDESDRGDFNARNIVAFGSLQATGGTSGILVNKRGDSSSAWTIYSGGLAGSLQWFAGAGDKMTLTSAGILTLVHALVLPAIADASIPNGGIAWSTDTPNSLKCRTPAGTLKTVTLA